MNRQTLIYMLVSACVASALTHKWTKANQVEQVSQTQERSDIVTRIIERSNGDKETIIVDKSTAQIVTKAIMPAPKLNVGATVQLIEGKPLYGVEVSKQVAGPLYVGARIDQKLNFGLSVGWAF